MTQELKKYVLYKSEEDGSDSYSFFIENDEQNIKLLEPSAKLIWSVEATSWDEACTKQHEYLGWEPYKSIDS